MKLGKDPKKTLGIKLPFLVMIIKNLKKYFTFEVQVSSVKIFFNRIQTNLAVPIFYCDFKVLDDKNVRRRFRASNYQSTTRVKPFICTMPMRLDDGWNQIQFNLSGIFFNYLFSMKFYGSKIFLSWGPYPQVLRVLSPAEMIKIHSDFTRRAYGTNYIETLRVQIHANCRIRRVYFSDRLYSEDELPAEFKLYLPVQNKQK